MKLRRILNKLLIFFSRKKGVLKVEDEIIVFGDSHSRAFSMNNNFLPVFIGAGKLNNFINSENAQKVQVSVLRICESLKPKKVILCFGEPDTRYYLGLGWYPWENKREFLLENYEASVKSSIERYSHFINSLKNHVTKSLMVFNVTPSIRKDQNEIVNYFNNLLEKECSKLGVDFIATNNEIYSRDEKIIKEEYFSDTVHLNNRIQILVEDHLLKKGIIEAPQFDASIGFKHSEIQSKFKFDERFGCYVLKD